jgi:signal transduction histidine kinase
LLLDDRDLTSALEEYARKFQGSTGMAIAVSGADCGRRLSAEEKVALFRIAQEALTNCARHAQAKAVAIELDMQSVRPLMSITDDGVGVDLAGNGRTGNGFGLLSMQERAEAIGGSWSIESTPGKGTRVMVRLAAGAPSALSR